MARELHCFSDGTDTVVARSVKDAKRVWAETTGGDPDDFDCHEVTKPFSIWCDTAGVITEPGDKNSVLVSKPPHEWANEYGRGFLCSTEF